MARNGGAYSKLRRSFCQAVVGVLVAPGFAIAQASKGVRRIGRLESGGPLTPEDIRKEVDALREFGWVEGQNLHTERRYANGRFEALQPLAEELVRAKVEVIVTGGTSATKAAMRATKTIPIVFRIAYDPVGDGLVASLAHPGGNVTGFSAASPEVNAKYLSLLKELLPGLKRIGVVESRNPTNSTVREAFTQSCRAVGIEPIFAEIAEGDVDGPIDRLAQQRVQLLVLRSDGVMFDHRFDVVAAAMKHRLPTMAEQPDIVRQAGALMSYMLSEAEFLRRAASYIDRVLRGASPGDLPVEQASKFHLMFNLKTAKALGLTIPKELLLRADEVI
jgi:putative ABC transport system substrate-binding protein